MTAANVVPNYSRLALKISEHGNLLSSVIWDPDDRSDGHDLRCRTISSCPRSTTGKNKELKVSLAH